MGDRAKIGSIAIAILACAGCATGGTQDQDGWVPDTAVDGIDTAGDTPVDTAYDPWADTTATFTDTFVDTAGDTLADTIDAADVPVDTGTDDVAADLPATCTVADLVSQTMCGAGRKCTFVSIDAVGNPIPICDTAGPQGWNQTCGAGGASDNCQAGYICLGSGTVSVCRRYCSSDSTCTSYPGGANAACEIGISHGGTEVIGVTTCSFHCDPLYQTGCNAGQACHASFPGDYTFFSDCTAAGTGSGCVAGTGSDCPAGSACITITDIYSVSCNTCLPYCGYSGGYPSCTYPSSCAQGTGWATSIGVCFNSDFICS